MAGSIGNVPGDGGAGPNHTSPPLAIVGAGPVGLITAIELARYGFRPVVLEAKNEIAWSSRAICISRRSLEILDRVGAGAAFEAKALPWSRGALLSRPARLQAGNASRAAGDRHAPFVNLQQFYTEQFLLDALPPGRRRNPLGQSRDGASPGCRTA